MLSQHIVFTLSFSLSVCDTCGEEFFEGCSEHPALRNEEKDLISIGQSRLKNAGRGAFNNSDKSIPVGTLFGPYKGEVIGVKEYENR